MIVLLHFRGHILTSICRNLYDQYVAEIQTEYIATSFSMAVDFHLRKIQRILLAAAFPSFQWIVPDSKVFIKVLYYYFFRLLSHRFGLPPHNLNQGHILWHHARTQSHCCTGISCLYLVSFRSSLGHACGLSSNPTVSRRGIR